LGGGRFVEIGPMTLRMVLFAAALIYSFTIILIRRLDSNLLAILLYFISTLLLSALIGLFNGAELNLVFEDIKPLSYFLMILFFYITINNIQSVMLVVKTIKVSSIVLMTSYLATLIGLYIGFIDFNVLYNLLETAGEVSFRSETGFFYKGFLYLCVGCIFFIFSNKIFNKLIAFLLFISIILTFTRGFLLAMAVTFVVYFVFFAKKSFKSLSIISLLVFFVLMLTPIFVTQLGDKSESNQVRLITYEQVKESTSLISVLFGHGLGIGVKERSIHMEVSYLEIFHKQGLIGLSFWILILLLILRSYSKIRNKSRRAIALPFVLSTILIYIQTATNPFLNNPIGMSMVLITLSVIRVLIDDNILAKRDIDF